MSLHWSDYAVMALYLIALVGIGIVSSRKSGKDSRSFLLGGGKMPALALGISCLMAALSAFSLVMVPGEIFNHGLSFWVLELIVPVFMLVAVRIFLPFYLKLGSFTPYEYLEYRYSPAVRGLVAGISVYARLIYLGMVLYSTSKIFEGAAGWPPWVSVLLVGGLALVFSTGGGLKTAVWTDAMQFVVLIGGLIVILGFLFAKIDGGFVGAITCAFRNGHGISSFSDPSFYTGNPYSRLCFWLLLLGQFMSPVSTMVTDQMTIQRLIAAGNMRNAMKTQLANTLLTIPTVLILWVLGLAVFSFYFQHPELPKPDGDTALFNFIGTQLPAPVPGLVISGMLAAVISTLNAVYNGMATIYLKEFHVRYLAPLLAEDKQVRIARIATIGTAVFSMLFGLLIIYSARWLRQNIVEASTIFNAFAIVVVPAFLYAILSKRASTLLAWVAAGLLWGIKFGTLTWYTLSTAAVAHWQPGMALGWGGPVGPYAGGTCLVAGFAIWGLSRGIKSHRKWSFAALLTGMFSVGYGIAMLLWSIFSNLYIVDKPMAMSFQWGAMPITISYVLIGIFWLRLGPVQPKEKYQGLTMFDHDEVIRKEI